MGFVKRLVFVPLYVTDAHILEQIPKVATTCNFEAIMDGYYKTLFPLNPSNIRPVIPSTSTHEVLSKPVNRESLSLVGSNC